MRPCYGAGRYLSEYSVALGALTPPVQLWWRSCLDGAGTVKWFNHAKGYRFSTPADGGKDVFVHHSSIVGEGFKSLAEGTQLQFEVVEGAKCLEARSVVAV